MDYNIFLSVFDASMAYWHTRYITITLLHITYYYLLLLLLPLPLPTACPQSPIPLLASWKLGSMHSA